jgi:hypothetical protein
MVERRSPGQGVPIRRSLSGRVRRGPCEAFGDLLSGPAEIADQIEILVLLRFEFLNLLFGALDEIGVAVAMALGE